MTSRLLESIPGDLLAYKQLEPGSMRHGYEITTERRTCTDMKLSEELRDNPFYTADGQLYTAKKKEVLWGITKLPQNLVLRNIDEAYRQLKETGNYFPPTEEAEASFRHADTVVVDMEGLKLVKDSDEYGHFVLDLREPKKLNSEQRKAAIRLFGPDEESFGLNMEILAETGKSPRVFALMPEYVQRTLKSQDTQYLGRVSWLSYFYYSFGFYAVGRYVYKRGRVRGVHQASVSEPEAPVGRAPESAGVPIVPPAPSEVRTATMEEILAFTRKEGFVAERNWKNYETTLRKFIAKK